MCLILFSYDKHPAYRLVLAANRDEFYDRPTAPAHFWKKGGGILAGRDEKAGGTWMGLTRAGRWAAVTNYRDFRTPPDDDAPSRGRLVTGFLESDDAPAVHLDDLATRADRYNGFNLLAGTPGAVGYLSNRDGAPRTLDPGLYGISNHLLDTPWPKVQGGKAALREQIDRDAPIEPESLLEVLADTAVPPDDELPDTGMSLERERMVAPRFIRGERYGTRSSTVLLVRRDGGVTFVERRFEGNSESYEDRRFDFPLEQ
jgi:uncharacterized protein with NRDE domain